jgi:hypothetical protein
MALVASVPPGAFLVPVATVFEDTMWALNSVPEDTRLFCSIHVVLDLMGLVLAQDFTVTLVEQVKYRS